MGCWLRRRLPDRQMMRLRNADSPGSLWLHNTSFFTLPRPCCCSGCSPGSEEDKEAAAIVAEVEAQRMSIEQLAIK